MKAVRWLLVLLGFLFARPALAQVLVSPGSMGLSALAAGGAVYARGRHSSLYLGSSYRLNYLNISPYYLVPPPRVNFYYASAPPPLLVVFNRLRPDWDDRWDDRLDLPPPRRQPADVPKAEPPPEEPLPGRPAGGFRPVLPEDRARAQQPPKPAPVKPDNLPPLPLERVDADPLAELVHQVALGRDAFAQRAYGRAAQHFRQATLAVPQDALGHFLLAEALAALGKYRDAVAAIHEGMRLRPDWPAQLFRPRELFDANQAEYGEQMRTLDDLVGVHRDDPVLLFLSAYHLWFDGRKNEARPLFQRAAALAADKADSERFLQQP